MTKHYMTIDFDDEIQYRDHAVTKNDIREMIDICYRMGCKGVIWRCTTLGRADYRSNIMERSDVPFNMQDHDEKKATGKWEAFLGDSRAKLGMPNFCEARNEYVKKSAQILADYDPPALVRELTKNKGLELYLWLDLFDEYAPGMGSRFLRENPHCQWLSRDGKEYFEGLRCYAYPEAVKNQLDVVEELCNYQPDGIYFATSCHSRHKIRDEQEDFYGFNDPIVDRYREKFDIDIRKNDFDKEKWHKIKGESITEFIRKARQIVNSKNIKLMLPAPIGDLKIWDKPLWTHRSPATFHVDWRQWVDKGFADVLIMGEYQPIWGGRITGYWKVIGKRIGLKSDQFEEEAAKLFDEYVKGRCEVLYWSGWIHGGKQRIIDDLKEKIKNIKDTFNNFPLDGVVWHELQSFERHNYFPKL